MPQVRRAEYENTREIGMSFFGPGISQLRKRVQIQCLIGILVALSWTVIEVSPWAFAGSAIASDQQSESRVGYDADGLLRISETFFELSAATGGDFYFWAPDEFASSNFTAGFWNRPTVSGLPIRPMAKRSDRAGLRRRTPSHNSQARRGKH